MTKSFYRSFLFFVVILLALCRGGLELVLPKKLAMILQFGGIAALSTLLFFPKTPILTNSQKKYVLFSLLFIADSLLSCFLTFSIHESTIWIVYLFFNFGLLWIGLLIIRPFKENELILKIPPILLFAGWLLVFVAFLEQIRLIEFGVTGKIYVVRPASLTGSFLHYPIVIVIIGLILLQWYALSKKKHYLLSGIVFCLSPLAAASRSGTLILIATVFLYPFALTFKEGKKMIFLVVLLIICGFTGLHFFSKESKSSPLHNLAYHIVMAASKKTIGNNVRLNIWSRVVSEWLGSNLLIGEEAGKYTNASNNIKAKKKVNMDKSRIAESSVLQLLSNFGLIGMAAFYAILFQIPKMIDPSHGLMKAAFFACLFQTLFYQSVEVVSFMTLLFLFPLISQTYMSLHREKLLS